MSLLVFRAEGLPWPTRDWRPLDGTRAYSTASRGFNVVLWQAGGLGYALVSDVASAELLQLAGRLVSAS